MAAGSGKKMGASLRIKFENEAARLLCRAHPSAFSAPTSQPDKAEGGIPNPQGVEVILCVKYAQQILRGSKIPAKLTHHQDGTYRMDENGVPVVQLSSEGDKLLQIAEWYFRQPATIDCSYFHPALACLLEAIQADRLIFNPSSLGCFLPGEETAHRFVFQAINKRVGELRKMAGKPSFADDVSQWLRDVKSSHAEITNYLESALSEHRELRVARVGLGYRSRTSQLQISADTAKLIEQLSTHSLFTGLCSYVIKLDLIEGTSYVLNAILLFDPKRSPFNPSQRIGEFWCKEITGNDQGYYIDDTYQDTEQLGTDYVRLDEDGQKWIDTTAKSLTVVDYYCRTQPPEGWQWSSSFILKNSELTPAHFSRKEVKLQSLLTEHEIHILNDFLGYAARTDQQTPAKINISAYAVPPKKSGIFDPEKPRDLVAERAAARIEMLYQQKNKFKGDPA